MKSAAFDKIGGAFAFLDAPFASHHNDRKRAAQYLMAALESNISWADAESDIRSYLDTKAVSREYIDEQVSTAKKYLEPWLE